MEDFGSDELEPPLFYDGQDDVEEELGQNGEKLSPGDSAEHYRRGHMSTLLSPHGDRVNSHAHRARMSAPEGEQGEWSRQPEGGLEEGFRRSRDGQGEGVHEIFPA